MYRTPLLVNTERPFSEYIKSLAKTGRKNHRASMKANEGREFRHIPFDYHLVSNFMAIWEEQEVFGKRPKWIFGPEHFKDLSDRNVLHCFAVFDKDIIGLHLIEGYGDYAYSQPPMYSKSHPELSSFMWFEMIRVLCDETPVKWFDLGGAFHGTWVDLLNDRSDPILRYKWRYVPQKAKEQPETELPWERLDCPNCGAKQIVLNKGGCKWCG